MDEQRQQDSFSEGVERRLHRLRRLMHLCTGLGLALLLVVAVGGIGTALLPRALGWAPYAVVSGSMEPNLPKGALAYVETTSPMALQQGDIAAFWDKDSVVVHRVMENDGLKSQLITKGDANEQRDPLPVPYGSVLGKVAFDLPLVGYITMGLATLEGKLLAGWVVLMAVALVFVGSIIGGMVRREEA